MDDNNNDNNGLSYRQALLTQELFQDCIKTMKILDSTQEVPPNLKLLLANLYITGAAHMANLQGNPALCEGLVEILKTICGPGEWAGFEAVASGRFSDLPMEVQNTIRSKIVDKIKDDKAGPDLATMVSASKYKI